MPLTAEEAEEYKSPYDLEDIVGTPGWQARQARSREPGRKDKISLPPLALQNNKKSVTGVANTC